MELTSVCGGSSERLASIGEKNVALIDGGSRELTCVGGSNSERLASIGERGLIGTGGRSRALTCVGGGVLDLVGVDGQLLSQ